MRNSERETSHECAICKKLLHMVDLYTICEDCFERAARKYFDEEEFDVWSRGAGDNRIAGIEERGHEYGYRYGTVIMEEEATFTAIIAVEGQDYFNEASAETLDLALKELKDIFGNIL